MTPHRCPTSLDELPTLPVRVKPRWKGLLAHLLGWLAELGAWLRVRMAVRFLDDYHTVIAGVHYAPRGSIGPLRRGLILHEGVHAWQAKTRALHGVRYLGRGYRRHAEAQAYALEVALGERSLEVAARSMADPIYAMGLSVEEAEGWILAYVARWWRDCTDIREQTQ